MEEILTEQQIREWIAYATIHPFGPRQETWHFARLGSWLTNVIVGGRGKTAHPKNLFPELDPKENIEAYSEMSGERKKEQTWQQQMAIMQMWSLAASE